MFYLKIDYLNSKELHIQYVVDVFYTLKLIKDRLASTISFFVVIKQQYNNNTEG